MRILKFGGSSVATAARRAAVADIVRRQQRRGPVTVVTSALAGVTDRIQQALADAAAGSLPASTVEDLRACHLGDAGATPPAREARRRVARTLADLERLLTGVALLGECPPAVRHRALAAGEHLALPLVAAALEDAGLRAVAVDGSELLVAHRHDPEGEPEIDLETSRCKVQARWRKLRDGEVAVVTGFVAGDGDGGTLILGRGASDLTATLLASFLDAEAVEIWSDVDGLLSGPPRWVPDASPLPLASYGDAAAMAHFGARVLHPEALAPAAAAGIPVWIRNSLSPETPGTLIDAGAAEGPRPAVSLLPAARRLRLRGPWHRRDLPRRVFAVLEGLGVRPCLVEPGLGTLEVVVAAAGAARAEAAFEREFAADGVVLEREDVAVVAAVGGGFGTMDEALRALRDRSIEPLAVSGSAAATLAVVERRDGPRAVACLHAALACVRPLPPIGSVAMPQMAGIA